MVNTLERCEGAFIGHAIASNYDASIYLALDVCESLLEEKKFNGQDIFARHMYRYHTTKCEVGTIAKDVYQLTIQNLKDSNNLTKRSFHLDEKVIDDIVGLTDKNNGGHTAGCGPAQRSYPIAFCSFIHDDDVFDCSILEAKLTHSSPLAGQVAGIVNVICRSLLKNEPWSTAVNSAFSTPNLHDDVSAALARHNRFPTPLVQTHAAYAPTVLNAALHIIARSTSPQQAFEFMKTIGQPYCASIVGILAGARWGIPMEMYKDKVNNVQLRTLREAACKLNDLFKIKSDKPIA